MLSQNALRNLIRDLLIELLSNYSPTFKEGRAINALRRFTESKLNYDEVWIDDVGNLIARYGNGNKRLAFIGHIDTIEGYIPTVVMGNVIKGRGAVDAKGPLTSAFVGASLVRESLKDSDITVYTIALVGEEGPSHGAWNLVRSNVKYDHVIICEPSNGNGVVIEYRGSILFKVRCKARSAHTAGPVGMNACDKLIKIWDDIRNQEIGNVSLTLVKLLCGETFNVTPKEGVMFISSRIPYGYEVAKLISTIRNTLLQGCTLSISNYTEPVRVSLNSTIVRALIRALLRNGVKPKLVRKRGTSDMNVLYSRVTKDIVAYGPGRSELAHTDDEAVSIDELVLGAKVYGEVIREVVTLNR